MSKGIWKIINKERGKYNTPQTNIIDVVVNRDGKKFKSPNDAVNAINLRFINAADACGAPKADVVSVSCSLSASNTAADRSLRLRPFTADEIFLTVTTRIPPKQSKDVYGLSMQLLRSAIIPLAPVLSVLFNRCIAEGTYPSPFKVSKVTPLFKGKGTRQSIDGYRPVSIIPAVAKVFEHGLSARLINYLDATKALSERQHAYREGRSTVSLTREVIGRVMAAKERKQQVALICCDLSKAFDVADHAVIATKLKHYGIMGKPYDILLDLMRDRQQLVDAGDGKHRSDPQSSPRGVAQGSSVSNILFSLLLNDLPNTVNTAEILMYADDVAAIVTARTREELQKRLSETATKLTNWFAMNGLALNLNKTHFIKFNLSGRGEMPMSVVVNGHHIEEVGTTTFLGFEIDRGLTWANHVNKICSKLGSACFALSRVSRFVSKDVARACYFATVHSLLQYGTELWGRAAEWKRVFRMQKRAIRALAHISRDTSAKSYFKDLGILTLPGIIILQVAVYVRSNPELYRKHRDVHSYQTRNADKLISVSRKLAKCSKLTHVMGPAVYNKLPDEIIADGNLTHFKNKLKRWLIGQAFYSVEEFIGHKMV